MTSFIFNVFYSILLLFSKQLVVNGLDQCIPSLHDFTPRHTNSYTVGVLAIRGDERAFLEFNATFATYLTKAVAPKFNYTLQFQMVPLDFNELYEYVEDKIVDFIYVNPSAYSCIDSQYGSNSLVSQISRRVVNGAVYELTQFGGVIFTLADRSDITEITDLKGKIIAAASISGLGSGLMQFRMLQQKGMSYINDPRQMVFTSNQGDVVKGVLSKQFDVGYVRTDQLEGMGVGLDQVKVIEPLTLDIDGKAFPFQSSTPLYAEWNLGALPHIPDDVQTEVQAAMMAIDEHAATANDIYDCFIQNQCTDATLRTIYNSTCVESCQQLDLLPSDRCDTTKDLALSALFAKKNGAYAGWQSSLSYMDLRNLLQDTGFINRNETTGTYECFRSKTIYYSIVCPEGHFRKSETEVENGCAAIGLPCDDKYQCVCEPCVKAFDVDVTPLISLRASYTACPKMSICGTSSQRETMMLRIMDNKKRLNANLYAKFYEGESTTQLVVSDDPSDEFTYMLNITTARKGVHILEIYLNDEQISQSPFRIEIKPRICTGSNEIADPIGRCVCAPNTAVIGGSCVEVKVLIPAIIVPIILGLIILSWIYLNYKRKQHDSIWIVKPADLHFDDPPVVIGRGTFGLVVLATYRGTTVAVKRVIPPRVKSKDKVKVNTQLLGRGDISTTITPLSSNNPKNSAGGRMKRRLSNILDEENLRNVTLDEHDIGTASGAFSSGVRGSGTYIPTSKSHNPSEKSWILPKNRQSIISQLMEEEKEVTADLGNHNQRVKIHRRFSASLDRSSQRPSGKTSSNSIQRNKSLKRLQFWSKDEYSKLKDDFIHEIRQLSKLRHPCITTVMGAVIAKYEEPMLIMEFMDHGSLYDLLHNECMIIEGDLILPILRDIVQGIRFLHSASPPVIHGDLKTHNILVDSKFRAKVADFGLSTKRKVGATGTPLWMAPELLRGESVNTEASDCYSFGIMLYELYSRKEPYEGEDFNDIITAVADEQINHRPPVPESCPPKIATLMKECLLGNQALRPRFEEIDNRLKRFDVDSAGPMSTIIHSRQYKKQHQENINNKSILLQVFPPHIVDALMRGVKVEPENHEMVTIFFSDIVGYTTISSKLPPIKVSDLLDRLYLQFDELSQKHDVFKIETIGDAYMAVTNLVKKQDDHAKRIALFAIDAIKASSETLIDVDDPSKGFVQIRIGFHSGPVVSNIVGSKNPKYTIVGDAVNTSSRMESNSLPMQIHCSDFTANIILKHHPEIPLTKRGTINVKGKGEMSTHWVFQVETLKILDEMTRKESALHVVDEVVNESISVHDDDDDGMSFPDE